MDQACLHRLAERKMERVPIKNGIERGLAQLSLFTASQSFNLSSEYQSKATIYNAAFVNRNEGWIDIKQLLLKHFLPENYQKLNLIKQQVDLLKDKLIDKQNEFEQLFLQPSPESHPLSEDLRDCFVELKQMEDDFAQYSSAFHNIINEHPLLASYSNILVIVSALD